MLALLILILLVTTTTTLIVTKRMTSWKSWAYYLWNTFVVNDGALSALRLGFFLGLESKSATWNGDCKRMSSNVIE